MTSQHLRAFDLRWCNPTVIKTRWHVRGQLDNHVCLTMVTIAGLIEYVVCSHQRAPQYYTESLRFRNCSYWGRSWEPYTPPAPLAPCQPEFCSEMGLHSILFPARGNFYVDTNTDPPYCSEYRFASSLWFNSLIRLSTANGFSVRNEISL